MWRRTAMPIGGGAFSFLGGGGVIESLTPFTASRQCLASLLAVVSLGHNLQSSPSGPNKAIGPSWSVDRRTLAGSQVKRRFSALCFQVVRDRKTPVTSLPPF